MDSLSHPALLLVDGVSSIGGLNFQMDAWKVDMAVTGSQKALSLPTGLAVVAASPKVCRARCSPYTVHDKQRTAQPVLASCWCHLRARRLHVKVLIICEAVQWSLGRSRRRWMRARERS